MSRSIEINPQTIIIDGINTPINDVIHAEASIVEDWTRVGVILAIALLGPILAMVVLVQMDGSRLLELFFGPVTLVITVVLGLIGCAIGVAWKKPWGVIVERQDFGHSTLLRCANSDEAESIASRIREVLASRGSGQKP